MFNQVSPFQNVQTTNEKANFRKSVPESKFFEQTQSSGSEREMIPRKAPPTHEVL